MDIAAKTTEPPVFISYSFVTMPYPTRFAVWMRSADTAPNVLLIALQCVKHRRIGRCGYEMNHIRVKMRESRLDIIAGVKLDNECRFKVVLSAPGIHALNDK